MGELDEAAASLRTVGLQSTPPHVLLTRWLALLGGENPTFLDAVRESDATVPGTRYTFLAVTETSVCYLKAEHDDEFWEHDRVFVNETPERVTPRTLVAWRRPLARVIEVWLAGDPWQWLPPRSSEVVAERRRLFNGGDALIHQLTQVHERAQALARTSAWSSASDGFVRVAVRFFAY
jgi:hypothetical protein